jgi:hypothetical protein
LDIVNSPDGRSKVGICKRGCGQTYPIEEGRDEEGAKILVSKYVSKYGTASGKSHSFIISQKSKKKSLKPGELIDNEKSDIQKAFGATDGVTIVDARESNYDGGWH